MTTPAKLSRKVAEVLNDEAHEGAGLGGVGVGDCDEGARGQTARSGAAGAGLSGSDGGWGFTLLAIDVANALWAGRLVGEHRDPFDRMIAAQALAEDMPVISKDAVLDGFGVRRIW